MQIRVPRLQALGVSVCGLKPSKIEEGALDVGLLGLGVSGVGFRTSIKSIVKACDTLLSGSGSSSVPGRLHPGIKCFITP